MKIQLTLHEPCRCMICGTSLDGVCDACDCITEAIEEFCIPETAFVAQEQERADEKDEVDRGKDS